MRSQKTLVVNFSYTLEPLSRLLVLSCKVEVSIYSRPNPIDHSLGSCNADIDEIYIV